MQEQDEQHVASAVAAATKQRCAEAATLRAHDNQHWWRLREAALYAASSCIPGGDAGDELAIAPPEALDGHQLLTDVLQQDLQASDVPPLLRGQALWLAAKLSSSLPKERAAQLLSPAVTALQHGQAAPVRMQACRAVARLYKVCDHDAGAQHVADVLRHLTDFTVQADLLQLFVDTLLVRTSACG